MNFKEILRISLFWLGIGFVLWLMMRSWESIQSNLQSVNWLVFSCSVIAAVAGNVIVSAIFWNLLLKHNVDVGYQKTIRLFFLAQIAKYIPGKIWVIAHQVSSIQREGSALGVAMANVELMVFLVITNLLLSVSLIIFFKNIPIAIVILFAGAFITWLFVKNDSLTSALKMLKRFKKYGGHAGSSAGMAFGFWGIVSCYAGLILFYLLSYALMLHSVFDLSLGQSAMYIASLSLAWLAGLIAFIVPAGMGIREVLFIAIAGAIGPGVDTGVLAAIAVISRGWLIAQDLLGIGLALLLGEREA